MYICVCVYVCVCAKERLEIRAHFRREKFNYLPTSKYVRNVHTCTHKFVYFYKSLRVKRLVYKIHVGYRNLIKKQINNLEFCFSFEYS